MLHKRALHNPSGRAYTYLQDGEIEAGHWTWASLHDEARAIAVMLRHSVREGQAALLLYPTCSLEFVAAFYGCLYAGVIGIPAPAPEPGRVARTLPRLQGIVKDAAVSLVLTTAELKEASERLAATIPDLQSMRWLATDDLSQRRPDEWRDPGAGPDSLAFLQYTSGSTGLPRGVMVSHGNLLHNVRAFSSALPHPEDSAIVCWVPHFHDFGLIYGIIHALYQGCHAVLMSPVDFAMRPIRWLRAISTYKATHSMGPNFAYELCIGKVNEEQKASLDLSRWRVVANGAEPIRVETLERFAKAFAACGFRPEVMCPVYGLAEATLILTASSSHALHRSCVVNSAALEQQNRVVEVEAGAPNARRLAGSGTVVPGMRLVIADPVSLRSCQPGEVGEIWAAGPSIAHGYWNRVDDSAKTFRAELADTGEGPFLRTGDLGFFRDGELFVTGRIKDLIIIRGQNFYPQDIEWIVQQAHPSVRPGCCAAFSTDIEGEEQIIVWAELDSRAGGSGTAERRPAPMQVDAIIGAIRQAVSEQLNLELFSVSLLKAGTIFKTSSGKIQRHACRNAWKTGTFEVLAEWRRAVAPARPSSALTLEDWLLDEVGRRLSIAREAIDPNQPFARYGMSSSVATGLAGDLELLLGRRVAPTALWDHPSIRSLARHLTGEPTGRVAKAPFVPAAMPADRDEHIAVVGIGCRFPGASNPEALWKLLESGGDAITDVPADRWDVDEFFDPRPGTPGRMCTRRGGFLDDVRSFDAEFFGVAPREAIRMDPRQRLLLEVAWEALEDAGIAPHALGGSRTGVFVGAFAEDYARVQQRRMDWIDTYSATGGALSIAANRLSYTLDLRGPSIAVDTACSSSLVAVHLACRSLQAGESELALAGGANLLLTPITTIAMSQIHALSPDGRCKAFDARADGYVRSEGVGVVVLKRLGDAIRDRDPIYAVILGSAVNQDGRTNGLTAPSRQAQEAMLREAYARAGVSPADVQYVECHGTGTRVGDTIEANALGAVLTSDRPRARPCTIGTAKSNLGHTEAAAGVAGLIKVALSLKHRVLPPSLHFETPNPDIPFEQLSLRVQTELGAWPDAEAPLIAGVSSFGFGGTNAHVVLTAAVQPHEAARAAPPHAGAASAAPEAPPATSQETSHATPPTSTASTALTAQLVPLSAHNPAALTALARAWHKSPSLRNSTLADIAYAASVRRSHHAHRLSLAVRSHDELDDCLAAFLDGQSRAGMASGKNPSGRQPKIAFVFPGQGSQWLGMTRELCAIEPVFRDALAACDRVIQALSGFSVLAALSEYDAARLSEIDVIQPILFAVQTALVALWRAWGVQPDAVVGHSMGEVAAAHAAGILSLEHAAQIICLRSRLLRPLCGRGAMAVVELSPEQAREAIAGVEDRSSIAAVNGPRSVVLSGEPDALRQILAALEQREVFCRWVKVDVASHSPQVEPLREELAQGLSSIRPEAGAVPLYSTVTGGVIDGRAMDAEYWVRNLREPVLFSSAVEALRAAEHVIFLELSPHPILLPAITTAPADASASTPAPKAPVHVLPSLRREQPERAVMLESLGAMYTLGYPVDFRRLHPAGGRSVPLPRYPWQREVFWADDEHEDSAGAPAADEARGRTAPHDRLDAAKPSTPARFYDDHAQVKGADAEEHYLTFGVLPDVVPGFSWLLAAYGLAERPEHARLHHDAQRALREVLFGEIELTAIERVLDFGCGYASDLLALGARYPHLRLQGYTISGGQAAVGQRKVSTAGLQDRITIHHRDSSKDDFPARQDLIFGFEVATHIQDKEALFANIGRHLENGGYLALADFLTVGSAIEFPETASYNIPARAWSALLARNRIRVITCVDISREAAYFLHDPEFEAHLAQVAARLGISEVEKSYFRAMDNFGRALEREILRYVLIVAQKDRRARPAALELHNERLLESPVPYAEHAEAMRQRGGTHADWLYEMQWEPKPRASDAPLAARPASGASWLIFADQGGVGGDLAARLKARGEGCLLVFAGSDYERHEASRYSIRPAHEADLQRLVADGLDGDWARCRGIVHLWSLDAPGLDGTDPAVLDEAIRLGATSALHVVRALPRGGASQQLRLWLVTRHAQPVLRSAAPLAVSQAPLWGLGRTLALELKGFWGGLIDLESSPSPRDAEWIEAELCAPDGEDQIAFRDGKRWVPRLARRAERSGELAPIPWRADGSYLITGGLGDLGLLVAQWMVAKGARHVVLMGRTPLPPRGLWDQLEQGSRAAAQVAAIRAMEDRGATVRAVSVDVGDAAQLTALFETARLEGWPSFRGVVHAAGVVTPQSVLELDDDAFEAQLRPKVAGAYHLHAMLADAPLDFFVLFSSGSSWLSSPLLGGYAAANAFLDALAELRRSQGRVATSIHWGFWADVGMAAREQLGLGSRANQAFSAEDGLAMLERILQEQLVEVGVLRVDWAEWRKLSSDATSARVLSRLLPRAEPRATPASNEVPDLRRSLSLSLSGWQRRTLLETHLRDQLALVLKTSPERVGTTTPLRNMGLDSLMSIEFRNRIEASSGLVLPATLAWIYPTLAEVAVHLAEKLGLSLESDAAASRDPRGPGVLSRAGASPPAALDEHGSEDEIAAALEAKLAALSKTDRG
ncbi:type I polyketide synthase [Sorangium sp. So ce1097]|uniref:type I polyketide synthase n=1 Tax=Sorangium sp. So ce1097 TaxID=3133330 RepID=UPI003F63B846